jgi:hypothetical protein
MLNFRDEITVKQFEVLDKHKAIIGKLFCGRNYSVIISRTIMVVDVVAHMEILQTRFGKLTDQLHIEFPALFKETIRSSKFPNLQTILLSSPDNYLDWSKISTQQFVTGIHYNTLRTYRSKENKVINPALKNLLRSISKDGCFMAILPLVMDELKYIYQDGAQEIQLQKKNFNVHRNRSRKKPDTDNPTNEV